MPVPISRPTGTKPWGLLGYLKDAISPPGYVAKGPFGSRSGRAPTDAELKAQGFGSGFHDNDPFERRTRESDIAGYPPAPVLPPYAGATPAGTRGVVHGVTPSGQVDHTQSDLYKQYALNPQGQFERYFQSPEMNQYFGQLQSSGAPKDVAAMTALAGQAKAPTDVPLATYYRAQSAAGRGNMPEIVEGLTYGLDPKKVAAMKQWAEANPMLAQREFSKKFPGGMGTQLLGGEGQQEVPSYNPSGFDTSALTSGDLTAKAFQLPGGAMTQGLSVSGPYWQANALAAQKTNPQNASSQLPISSKVEDFLQGLAVSKAKPGTSAFGI